MRDDGRTDPGTSRSRSPRSDFHLLDQQIVAETALDGIYAIRTDVPKTQMSAADTVSNYTALANVEGGRDGGDCPLRPRSMERQHVNTHGISGLDLPAENSIVGTPCLDIRKILEGAFGKPFRLCVHEKGHEPNT